MASDDEETELKFSLKLVPILSNPRDYRTWAQIIEAYFTSLGWWHIISKETTARKAKKQEVIKKIMCATILRKIADKYKEEVQEFTEPRTIWQHLELLLVGDTETQRRDVNRQLHRLKNTSMEHMMAKYRALVARYKTLGGETSEVDLCYNFIEQVPRRFHLTTHE